MNPRWINTPTAAVNMAQVCRVEFRHTDIQASDEIDGFILFMADGATLSVLYTDCAFEEIGEELAEAGFVLALREGR